MTEIQGSISDIKVTNYAKYTPMEQLRTWLFDNGFKIHPFIGSWIGARPVNGTARRCEENEDKELLLVVHPYERDGYQNHTVEISGCTDGKWFKLECYGLRNEDIRKNLFDIERRLVLAWNVIGRKE